ncbi:hypothetical protein TL16_g03620 [Triparma laevis f. inornata]|uniref:Flavodoxin-like domain-containing protein n=2 Tax=Triparma laevis TaxID=1534972 RepID=A0A9W7DWL1_9STRA|nr:hypothetical protein TrLO_g11279 [Triparma laevis f. longispina]GMH63066.1 hypothetical protein TL16_g03620 [Triparma laevis f. inornata]
MSQKVLFLYGTETNTAERAANHLVKQLKFSLKDVTIEGPLAGNKMTDFEEIKKYDAVLIATSSYGDGDAPSCYDKFFEQLHREVKNATSSGSKPLSGLQHAVLGFGSTSYETFMNCPRITDKLFGELGSRRMQQRIEIDEIGEETEEELIDKFEVGISKCLNSLKQNKGKKEACTWDKPDGEILDKFYIIEEGGGEKKGGPGMVGVLAILAVFAGIYFMKMKKEAEGEE